MSAVKELEELLIKLLNDEEEVRSMHNFFSCLDKDRLQNAIEICKKCNSEDELFDSFPWDLYDSPGMEGGKTYTREQVETWLHLPFYVTAVWMSFYYDIEVNDRDKTLRILRLKYPWPDEYEGPFGDDIEGKSEEFAEFCEEDFWGNPDSANFVFDLWEYTEFQIEDNGNVSSFEEFRKNVCSFLFAFGPAGLEKGWCGVCYDSEGREFKDFDDLIKEIKSGAYFRYSFGDSYWRRILNI